MLSVFCLLTTLGDATKLDKSNDFNILDDVIEEQHRNEASEIDENNLIYSKINFILLQSIKLSFFLKTESESNANNSSSVEITAKIEEDHKKQFFKNQDHNSLGMDTLTIIW